MLELIHHTHSFVHVHGIGIRTNSLREVLSYSIPGVVAVFLNVQQSRSILNFKGYDMRWSIQDEDQKELSEWSQFNIMLIGDHQLEAFCICVATHGWQNKDRAMVYRQHTLSFTNNTRGHVSPPFQERSLLKPFVKHWHSFDLVSIRGASDKAYRQMAIAKLTGYLWDNIEDFDTAFEDSYKVVSEHLAAKQYEAAWIFFEVAKILWLGWDHKPCPERDLSTPKARAHESRQFNKARLSLSGAKAALGRCATLLSSNQIGEQAHRAVVIQPHFKEALLLLEMAGYWIHKHTDEYLADLHYHQFVARVLWKHDNDEIVKEVLCRAAELAPDDLKIRRAVQYAALDYYPATLAVVMDDFLMTPALASLEQYQIWKEEEREATEEEIAHWISILFE